MLDSVWSWWKESVLNAHFSEVRAFAQKCALLHKSALVVRSAFRGTIGDATGLFPFWWSWAKNRTFSWILLDQNIHARLTKKYHERWKEQKRMLDGSSRSTQICAADIMTTVGRWNETNRHQQGGSWASNFCKPRSEYIVASLSPKRFLKSTVLCLSVPGLMSLPFFGLQMSSSPRHSAELLRKVLQLFLRYYNTNRAGNIISFDVWKQCYQAGTLRRIYQQIHEAVPGVWATMEMLWRDMNLTGFRLAHARVWELLVEYFSLSAIFRAKKLVVWGWAEGLLKPHNHTVSVTLTWFQYLGLVDGLACCQWPSGIGNSQDLQSASLN